MPALLEVTAGGSRATGRPTRQPAEIPLQRSISESQSAIGGSGDVRAAAEAHGTIGAGNVGHDETHKLPSFPKAVLRESGLTER